MGQKTEALSGIQGQDEPITSTGWKFAYVWNLSKLYAVSVAPSHLLRGYWCWFYPSGLLVCDTCRISKLELKLNQSYIGCLS
jgi:hypothetical protein